ncbi:MULTISPECIES: hypothetical protein [Methylorubrum]|uniref:hypothetical protein n=1 Tax=Methylorubrum TaxID=2282523 RepID=UPI001648EAC6|nr:hypothetical protein [Methylorubrum populi]
MSKRTGRKSGGEHSRQSAAKSLHPSPHRRRSIRCALDDGRGDAPPTSRGGLLGTRHVVGTIVLIRRIGADAAVALICAF